MKSAVIQRAVCTLAGVFAYGVVLLRGNVTDTAARLLFVVSPLLLGIYLARWRGARLALHQQTTAIGVAP